MFNVGDRVLVKEHPFKKCTQSNCMFFAGNMRQYIGKIATIEQIGGKYLLDIDHHGWNWSDCMLFLATPVAPGIYKVDKQEKRGGETMTEFKEGDTIRMKERCYPFEVGDTATLVMAPTGLQTSKKDGSICAHKNYWELISSVKTSSMTKTFSRLARKLLDKHTRAMVKVGWLDENLEPTTDGINRVVSDYILANKEELGEDALKILKRQEKKEKE